MNEQRRTAYSIPEDCGHKFKGGASKRCFGRQPTIEFQGSRRLSGEGQGYVPTSCPLDFSADLPKITPLYINQCTFAENQLCASHCSKCWMDQAVARNTTQIDLNRNVLAHITKESGWFSFRQGWIQVFNIFRNPSLSLYLIIEFLCQLQSHSNFSYSITRWPQKTAGLHSLSRKRPTIGSHRYRMDLMFCPEL